MRILFIHSPSDLYGASRSLLRLSRRLVKDGHVVRVILAERGPLEERLLNDGVATIIKENLAIITRKKFKSLRGIFSVFFNLPLSVIEFVKIIQQFHPHIVHTNTSLILTPGITAKIMGIPHIWHIREFFTEFTVFWKWYQKCIDLFSDKIICVSTPLHNNLKKKY